LTLKYAELAIRNGEAADALSEVDALLASQAALDKELLWRAFEDSNGDLRRPA